MPRVRELLCEFQNGVLSLNSLDGQSSPKLLPHKPQYQCYLYRYLEKKRAPKGPLSLTEVCRSPPDIPHLLEECHDLVDYRHENVLGRLIVGAPLDEITTLFRML